jgi:osmotically-inducible protein OsmY
VNGRAFALAGAILVSACSSGDSHAPADQATIAPTTLLRDGLIYAAVKARLAGADIDSATRISVAVHDDVVTLRGIVKDDAARQRDVHLVSGMRGVARVDDQLRIGHVGPSTAQTVRDVALVAAVESALTAQAGINVARIKVTAAAGRVSLSGTAPTAAIKSTLVAAAEHTPGVRNVVDAIVVKQ